MTVSSNVHTVSNECVRTCYSRDARLKRDVRVGSGWTTSAVRAGAGQRTNEAVAHSSAVPTAGEVCRPSRRVVPASGTRRRNASAVAVVAWGTDDARIGAAASRPVVPGLLHRHRACTRRRPCRRRELTRHTRGARQQRRVGVCACQRRQHNQMTKARCEGCGEYETAFKLPLWWVLF